ncbi:MAG: DUF1343 domain-containing protein [Kiritimatiellae bacterium]|nr:DUF1343 domain-containing protein [Kiritimatiellia bacterium]
MINYEGLLTTLAHDDAPLGLLTMQASGTMGRIAKRFPGRVKALFSTGHGFAGVKGVGASAWDSFWNMPSHALCGDHRRPTKEMLSGIGRMVVDLCDIGVRCYPVLATIKDVVEVCAEEGIPVTVLDHEVPMGGVMDGPMRKLSYASALAPLNVPLCYSMTPGECATWIKNAEGLDLDLTVIRLKEWSHMVHEPWPNFVPPCTEITTWDSAVLYPLTVFTDAYPAIDCDRCGPLSRRLIGAPWMDTRGLIADLAPGLDSCGVSMCPYRYTPAIGRYKGFHLNGILFSVSRPNGYYPVTAAVLVYTALLQRHSKMFCMGANPDLLDRIFGSTELRDTIRGGTLDELFQNWIEQQDEFMKTRVDLYK